MKKVIITGGTKGFGLAYSNILKSDGWEVITVARSDADQNIDLANYNGTKELIRLIENSKPDIIILNAGYGSTKPFEEYSPTDIQDMQYLNGTSKAIILNHFFNEIKHSKMKFIVASSIAGKLPSPLMAAYSASKAYVTNLIDTLNGELYAQGIKNLIIDASPGNINTKTQSPETVDYARYVLSANKSPVFNKPLYLEVLKKPENNWEDFVSQSFLSKFYRINSKKIFHVFDFDGTIEFNGIISDDNISFLNSKNDKAINTSRSLGEIPKKIREKFKYIMTLNGSKFYIDGREVKSYNKILREKVNELVEFAINNDYNIAFNNTKSYFQNVTNNDSIMFMKKNGIRHSEVIDIPENVYEIAISSSSVVKDFKGCKRQSERFIEYSENDKSNISKHFKNYYAYGDSENDVPMFESSIKFMLVENGELTDI